MNRTEILDKVAGKIREIFDDPELEITDETTAGDVEEWDSLEQINILVAMEKLFGVKFSVGEVEGLRNVGELVSLIESKL